MKTRLCVCLTALAFAVLAGGWLMGDDKKPDEPPRVKGQLPAHFKKLGLSDKQIQQIYKIEADYRQQIRALQEKIDDLKKAEHLDVNNVLTDEQKTRLKELLTAEVPDKPTTPEKDKPTVKDKPAPAKDKPVLIDKDKAPPAKDKDK